MHITSWACRKMVEGLYDVCVVGGGMFGSAAAKWLTKLQQGAKVCLIGPKEPTEEEWRCKDRKVFGAHYDEGRITRELDETLIWGILAQRAIQEYRHIEQESGMKFYKEVGCTFIDFKDSKSIEITKENAEKQQLTSFLSLDAEGLRAQYPYLHAEQNWECLHNFKNAGYISARKLVAAQQKIAASRGCDVIEDIVVDVCEEDKSGEGFVKVRCQKGREVAAKRVLLSTGAFTNCHGLLPRDKEIDFSPSKEYVVMAEVSEEYAKKWADMPSLLSSLPGKLSYMLPPIKYPDGKYYMKIGDDEQFTHPRIDGLENMAEWFRSKGQGDDRIEATLNILKFFVPDLDPISVSTQSCVVSHTPTDMLYCDMITQRLGAVVGGTGRGAKSSDEIGKMAALMIAKGAWDYDLPAENFKLRFKDTNAGLK